MQPVMIFQENAGKAGKDRSILHLLDFLTVAQQQFLVETVRDLCRSELRHQRPNWTLNLSAETKENAAAMLINKQLAALPLEIAAAHGFSSLKLTRCCLTFTGAGCPGDHLSAKLESRDPAAELEMIIVLGADSSFQANDSLLDETNELIVSSGDVILLEPPLIGDKHGFDRICQGDTGLFSIGKGHLSMSFFFYRNLS